ncbi:MAG: hypothetical protein KY476_10870 [Planctomycetes bacterium]|nr:hypothetical protein [Planctomycetota bacterium]
MPARFFCVLLAGLWAVAGCSSLQRNNEDADKIAEQVRGELFDEVSRDVEFALQGELDKSREEILAKVPAELRADLQVEIKAVETKAIAEAIAEVKTQLPEIEAAAVEAAAQYLKRQIEEGDEANAIRLVGELFGYDSLAGLLTTGLAGAGAWWYRGRRMVAKPKVETVQRMLSGLSPELKALIGIGNGAEPPKPNGTPQQGTHAPPTA